MAPATANMNSSFAFFSLFFFLLFASKISARKDVGEYWRAVTKDQPVPESIQGLIPKDSSLLFASKEKTNCHTNENLEHKEEKLFARDFESVPTASVYKDDKLFTRDFESAGDKLFLRDFESVPSITAYKGDKLFLRDFESVPSLTAYKNDIKLAEEKSFVKDFDPRPNLSSHSDNDVGATKEKPFVDDFEPRPNLSVYHD